MQLVNVNVVFVCLHVMNYASIDEIFDVRSIISPSHDGQLFHLRWHSFPTSDESLSDVMIHPEGLSLEFENVQSSTWNIIKVRFRLLWLENGFPPWCIINFDFASELTITFDEIFVFHVFINPFESFVTVLDCDFAT